MESIKHYFNAEKSESIIFILIGLLAILFAVYFFTILKTPFYKGFAIPLIVVGLIQVSVGLSVLIRTPKDIIRVESYISTQNHMLKTEELPRMEVVVKNFVIYRYVEIFLILAGLVLMFAINGEFMKGIGLGLFIQASLTLALDFFAEKRAHLYIEFLKGFHF